MQHFAKEYIIILPRAEEYRHLYNISLDDVLLCLNDPDTREGLATDHYTVEKVLGDHHIYVYYYMIFPLQAKNSQIYAVIDFIGYTTTKEEITS